MQTFTWFLLVTLSGPGATFGEVALISEEAVRTASIIIDEPSDLIVIDRQLYNRSVKEVLQKVNMMGRTKNSK